MQPDERLKLMEQHWLHCRHIEHERALFMNVYALITGGILAYMASQENSALSDVLPFLVYFLMLFTFFGFLLTTRWIHAFEHHRERVNLLIKAILNGSVKNEDLLTKDIPEMRPKMFGRILKTRYLFPLFYLSILFLLPFILPFILQDQIPVFSTVFVSLFPITASFLFIGFVLSLRDLNRQYTKKKRKGKKSISVEELRVS